MREISIAGVANVKVENMLKVVRIAPEAFSVLVGYRRTARALGR